MPVAKPSPTPTNTSTSNFEDDLQSHQNFQQFDQPSQPQQALKFQQQLNDEQFEEEEDEDDTRKRSGRRKINIEYIKDKARRHITFSKRKNGIMKKAYELATLTGTQVLLLVVSESGLVYTFTTAKLSPVVKTPDGQLVIQKCLNNQYDEDSGDVPNNDVEDKPSIKRRGRPARGTQNLNGDDNDTVAVPHHPLKRQKTTEFHDTTLDEATKASMRAPIVPAVPTSVVQSHHPHNHQSQHVHPSLLQPSQQSTTTNLPINVNQFSRQSNDEYVPRTTFYDANYLSFDQIDPSDVIHQTLVPNEYASGFDYVEASNIH